MKPTIATLAVRAEVALALTGLEAISAAFSFSSSFTTIRLHGPFSTEEALALARALGCSEPRIQKAPTYEDAEGMTSDGLEVVVFIEPRRGTDGAAK